MNFKKALAAVSVALLAGAVGWVGLRASDHDDGETDKKSRSLNLTDLYVFREGDQTGVPADDQNLILIMNSNPRSLPQQQYFFSTNARYEFHATQRSTRSDPVTGLADVTLRFEFGAPDSQGRQAITFTAVRNGQTFQASSTDAGAAILSTPLSAAATPVANAVTLGGSTLTMFAGLREDPFFFDVEQFFKMRADFRANGTAATTLPRDPDHAVDFAQGYNVNAIVVRVPLAFLQNGNPALQTFDVWETITVPN